MMKAMFLFFLIMSGMCFSYAARMSNDTLKVDFGNRDIKCKGNIIIKQEGEIVLQLALHSRNVKTLVVIDPKQIYLHLYEPNDSNVMVIEVMLGSQHLCPFNPYDIEHEVFLKRIPPSSELLINNEYEIPSYCTRKQIRYEVILIYKELEELVVRSDSIYIENLNVRCLNDSFFSGPTTIEFGDLKRRELVGGIKSINMYQRKPLESLDQQ